MIHLISYGNNIYNSSKQQLLKEATKTGWFSSITIYGPEDIDNDFKNMFKDVLNKPRGNGYWIWKNYFIKQKLIIMIF